jgi:tetratricopeptide (TPR) repeat protein
MSVKIFYSYAHEDRAYRETLEKHLSTLRQLELVTEWSDRNISAGKEWTKVIDSNLNIADIILLLISPDFMHSDYCHGTEMKRALERHNNGTARVIPIILRHGDYEGAAFNHLQSLPTGKIPVAHRKWSNRDEAFSDVAQGIRKVVKELLSEQWLYEGNIHFYRQQYDEALAAYKQAIHFDSANALAYLGKGRTLDQLALSNLFENGDCHTEALAAFEQAIRLDATNSLAYEGKAKVLLKFFNPWNSDTMKEIMNAYQHAISLTPTNESAYIGQAEALMQYFRYEEAIVAFEKAIEVALFPNQDAYEGKGKALYLRTRYEEALATCEQTIREFPKNGYIHHLKGLVLHKLKRYQQAHIAFEKAITLDFQTAHLYATLGDTLLELDRHQEALDTYDRAIFLDPELSDAYEGKGKVLKLLAEEAFKKAGEKATPLGELDDTDPLGDLEDHPF